jgi:hypothetical protein
MQRRYSGKARDESFVLRNWAKNISEDASEAVLEQGEKVVSSYEGGIDRFTLRSRPCAFQPFL